MRVVLFCQSLISDWNHGNAHFLRGVAVELLSRGHQVDVYEPHDSWSRLQLLADAGPSALARFRQAYPMLRPQVVDLEKLPLEHTLDGADVVIVHEWNSHALVARVGEHRARGGRYALLFHDTHHRSVTDVPAMNAYRLDDYDGILAFGEAVRERYVARGWGHRAWTWHEAADTRVFAPKRRDGVQDDLVWIGNWGDDERSEELRRYLIEPVRTLGLRATVYGVRYPDDARRELADAGIRYGGWLANYDAPQVYAAHRATIHVPRRPYVDALPGIPTIRVFEALACGIPLVSTLWHDVEGLFAPGDDFLVAASPEEMADHLRALQNDAELRRSLAEHGLATIRRRHTCAHRVDELLAILGELQRETAAEAVSR